MFIKELQGTHKRYLYLSRSVRKDGKVVQENLVRFGATDSLNEREIKSIALNLLSYCKDSEQLIAINEIQEESRLNWGACAIVHNLLELFEIPELIDKQRQGRKIRIDILSVLKLLIVERLIEPKSKYASFNRKSQYVQELSCNLHDLYRTLDFVEENSENIKKHLYDCQKKLFKLDMSVVFYDVTTLYFESKKDNGLSEFGYSKDCKFNDVQVVVGALIDKTGRPLDYEVFSGSTYEGHTLAKFVNRMKEKFNVTEVILVCDRGINSSENLIEILGAGSGFNFIVGHRLRTSSKSMQAAALSNEGYIDLPCEKEEVLKYKILEFDRTVKTKSKEKKTISDKILITFSSKRARKDKVDRERLVEKAKDLVGQSSLLSKRGAQKYLKTTTEQEHVLNEDKILEDSKWDGYYSIEFSKKDMSAEEILSAYHSLWRIENLFRSLKSHLEARPIFHWTPKRIQGHFVVCFLTLVLERTIELEWEKNFGYISQIEIREAANSLQVSKVTTHAQSFYVFSKLSVQAEALLQIAKITAPPPIMEAKKFEKLYV